MILHSLTDKSCKILQSPPQKVMQDLSGMISPDIVPKSVVILHTKSCKIIEVFNPRSCLCDLTGIILRDLSRLFRHDLSGYSSKIHCDLACKILQFHGSYCFKILQEFFLGFNYIRKSCAVSYCNIYVTSSPGDRMCYAIS